MSKASDWAAEAAGFQGQVDSSNALRPAPFAIEGLNVTVTDSGGVHFDREAYLTSEEIIDLETWINTTFGPQ